MEEQGIVMIAGRGVFPKLFIEQAYLEGVAVDVIALKQEAQSCYLRLARRVIWVDPAQFQSVVDAALSCSSRFLVFVGGIRKRRLFLPFSADARTLGLLKKAVFKQDDSLLRMIAQEFEQEGFSILDSTLFLSQALAPLGVMTHQHPDAQAWADIHMGLSLARSFGAMDVGQTVVVKSGAPIALEAIEGTDACILRAGVLARAGAIAIKVAKPLQDRRFDLPVIGPVTMRSLAQARMRGIAVESHSVLILEQDKTLRYADALGLFVVGV